MNIHSKLFFNFYNELLPKGATVNPTHPKHLSITDLCAIASKGNPRGQPRALVIGGHVDLQASGFLNRGIQNRTEIVE
ncbi:uncharacterized protein LACBIDRAFT_298119 [Laccaria bicolor S238N-H82]|uniref:Predicted protein n=1 Tax=Laccaria bicolor (strain S238N-H82 / ATCC MYA-4686) TaxID=486041 RepID=B0DCA5_LACBS|nr:uncharacterized protein LACBIDRAFT_298119 [Laccaria bicolor S238N-H82]EDR07862.1 predicted protein [Laccaria bicolor S238N-H82]|eukprot:XP_001881651.1 predicted protein [Laccaria bicolor S238N-H82]